MTDEKTAILSVPLDVTAIARLVFERGVGQARIDGDAGPLSLLDAVFDGPAHVLADKGTVSIRYPRIASAPRPRSELSLSRFVSWSIEAQGGLAGVTAILADIRLRSLLVAGGAHDLALVLRRPAGTVPICIGGGVTDLFLRRPASVPVRITVRGGASDLVLDDHHLEAVGGACRWQSPGFDAAVARYDIEIAGGVAGMKLTADATLVSDVIARPQHAALS